MILPEWLALTDSSEELCFAWTTSFEGVEGVSVSCGDYFSQPADAMVSPANSFGIMDGGLDLAIRDTLSGDIQRAVQDRILEQHHGELPVGCAEIVQTEDTRWPYLIVAPTMRIPERIMDTLNPYVAFRAILLSIARHNVSMGTMDISTVIVSGLGTGVGRVSPERCAIQMRAAYDSVYAPARIPSYGAIHDTHARLKTC